jgi:hypothetical protein
MKRFALAAVLCLGYCFALPAQETSSLAFAPAAQPAAAARNFHFTLAPELSAPAGPASSFLAFPAEAALPGQPAPRPGVNDEEGYRFDLGVGYEFVHFKSAPFSANLSGLHTDLTYNVTNWFGLEGNVVSAFGTKVFSGEMSKYVLYTFGGRISAGPSRRRWTPWVHLLVGGAHLWPQVAGEGRNGFALQTGGGADYSFRSRLSFRAEADYVRTQLYSSSQNNFQIGAGLVIHF